MIIEELEIIGSTIIIVLDEIDAIGDNEHSTSNGRPLGKRRD